MFKDSAKEYMCIWGGGGGGKKKKKRGEGKFIKKKK